MPDSQPSDGTYVIHNGANVALAMNSAGAVDSAGANVQLYTNDGSDAVYVHLRTHSDGTRRLSFACTGKTLDIVDGRIAQGNNVRQWDDNGSMAQRFDVKAVDGTTITVGGTAYQAYKIYAAADSGYLVEAAGTGTPASGTNLCISKDEGTSADQMWAFVPANPVPQGTYVIRPKVNTALALDVNGSSHSSGARVMISGYHVGTGVDDGRNQVVWVRNYDSEGRAKVYFTHSMLLMELAVAWSSASAGDAVVQSSGDGGTDQQWIMTPHGDATVDGVRHPCFCVRNYASQGESKVLDVAGGRTSPGTWLQVWPQNWSKAQDFCFVPVAMPTSRLPQPSVRGIGWKPDGSDAGGGLVAQQRTPDDTAYVSWTGQGTTWEVRWRAQTRAPGRSAGSWGPWRSVPDGSMSNQGWGQEWRPTLTTEDGGTHVAPIPLAGYVPDNESIDWTLVEVQVRRCESDWDGHAGLFAAGPGPSRTYSVAWCPTVHVTQAAWSPDGIRIAYASDYARGGNTVVVQWLTVAGEAVMPHRQTYSGMPSSGTVTVPLSAVTKVPADGAALRGSMWFDADHAGSSVPIDTTVRWDASHGITVTPTYSKTDRLTLSVTAAAHDSDEAWAVGHGTMVRLDQVSRSGGKVTWDAMPPLGAGYQVCIVSKSGTSWGTSTDDMPSLDDGAMVWNWVDSTGARRAAIARTGRGSVPKRGRSVKQSTSSLSTTGRAHPVIRFGKTSEVQLDASISIPSDTSGRWETEADFVALADARHATFRDPSGLVATVAVTGVDMPRDAAGFIDVNVTQEEESL